MVGRPSRASCRVDTTTSACCQSGLGPFKPLGACVRFEFLGFLTCSGHKSFVRGVIRKYFLSACGLSFHFLKSHSRRFLITIKSDLSVLSCMNHTSDPMSIILPSHGRARFLLEGLQFHLSHSGHDPS